MKGQDRKNLNTVGAKAGRAIERTERIEKEFFAFKNEMANIFIYGGAFLFFFALLWDFIADLTNQHFNPGISTHQKILIIVGLIGFAKGANLKWGRK